MCNLEFGNANSHARRIPCGDGARTEDAVGGERLQVGLEPGAGA